VQLAGSGAPHGFHLMHAAHTALVGILERSNAPRQPLQSVVLGP
jgi:hypothetical protein